MTDLIEEGRAAAERLRGTVRPDDTADLIDRLCDALEECGYDLTGQWAAKFELADAQWNDELVFPCANEAAAREVVRTGRQTDPRWKLIHRHVGPWMEVDDE